MIVTVVIFFPLCQKHISSQLEGGATSVPEADNKRSDSDSKMTEESTNKQMNTEWFHLETENIFVNAEKDEFAITAITRRHQARNLQRIESPTYHHIAKWNEKKT